MTPVVIKNGYECGLEKRVVMAFLHILIFLQNWINHISKLSNLKFYGYKPVLSWAFIS